MKKIILLGLSLVIFMISFAQERMLLYNGSNVLYNEEVVNIGEINFMNNISIVHNNFGNIDFQFPFLSIDSITFVDGDYIEDSSRIIYITYIDNSVSIINPMSAMGVNITANGTQVMVNANSAMEGLTYHLSGSSEQGSFTIQSDEDINLIFSNLSLVSLVGPAIKVLSDVKVSVTVQDNSVNMLADAVGHSDKAAFESEGQIIFTGMGTLNVIGNTKHAIFSNDYIRIINGNIHILDAVSDGLHSDYFQMYNGSLDITADGDGIDGDRGFIEIYGGNITITTPSNDGKSMKSDSIITINGGEIFLTVSGAQAKGLKSGNNIILNGGNIQITASGSTILNALPVGSDPSYCSGIKSDKSVIINENTNLTINCTSSNIGGKGISADEDLTINGGYISVTTSGNGATYTNSSNIKDSYTSTCLKCDGNMILNGGEISCSSTGTGGKGINVEGSLVIGVLNADDEELILNVSTSGERFAVTSSWGSSADYANPKAIKSQGPLTINSGTITVHCTQQNNEGGEGIESKSTLTINGGNIEVECTNDDAINASSYITINGGNMYVASTRVDAIDGNSTMTINGGFIIAFGGAIPEAAFDCDNNTFRINGGILVGAGGSNSNPATTSAQHVVKYAASSGNAICVYNASNVPILTMQLPTLTGGGGFPGGGGAGGSGMSMLFSDPNLTPGTYTLKYGGSISGGSNFHGYYTGATYSGGSTKTFTVGSNAVITVN